MTPTCGDCIHRLDDGVCEAFLLPCGILETCDAFEEDVGQPRGHLHAVVVCPRDGGDAVFYMRGCCESFMTNLEAQIGAFGWRDLPPQEDRCRFCGERIIFSLEKGADA